MSMGKAKVEKMTTNMSTSNEEAREAYAEFEEKVKRTVFLDNLSPKVTFSVIKTALGQFGEVLKVEFIENFAIPYPMPKCALVEMESSKQAGAVIEMMTNYPFVMLEMPRPVRALPAEIEMFSDRPSPPDRKIKERWVEPSDPKFAVAKKSKALCKKHTTENLALIKLQWEEENKLAKHQDEFLKSNYKKFCLVEKAMRDGSVARLARHYGINLGANDDIFCD